MGDRRSVRGDLRRAARAAPGAARRTAPRGRGAVKTAQANAAEATSGTAAPPGRSRRLPLGGWRLLPAAMAVFLIAFPFASDDLFWQNMIILSMLFAIGAVGLNVISGWGGYISLGQSAFVGIGAYTVGLGSVKIGGDPF